MSYFIVDVKADVITLNLN